MHVRLPRFLGLGAGRAWAFCSDEVRDELPIIEAGACCQALHHNYRELSVQWCSTTPVSPGVPIHTGQTRAGAGSRGSVQVTGLRQMFLLIVVCCYRT